MRCALVLIASLSLTGGVAAQVHPASVSFADVVQLVQQQGWRISLGDMCATLELPRSSSDCNFQQVSVQETEGRGDPRGFNVPVASDTAPSYTLIFHLSPLVGEFFVVSPEGHLITAFLRFKGTGYNRVPNEELSQEFNRDMAYWTNNLRRLKKTLQADRPEQP
jgi:hypothetical protein